MFDQYFDEFDPEERKQILDNLQPDAEEEQSLEQIRTLFSLRYKENKKGGYDDAFLGAMMSLHFISEKTTRTGRRQIEKEIQRVMQILCLGQDRDFSADILFAEMYQLIYYYMSLCMEDHNFCSVLFNFGRMSEENITRKIQTELLEIKDIVSSYAEEKNNYSLLVKAIEDTINDRLKTGTSTRASKQGVKKIDQR